MYSLQAKPGASQVPRKCSATTPSCRSWRRGHGLRGSQGLLSSLSLNPTRRHHQGLVLASYVDRTLEIKISIARGTDKLDLSELELDEIPDEVFTLDNLEELSIAGNRMTSIPGSISQLGNLKRLQAAGNNLTSLPDDLGSLSALEGLWVHGNLLQSLPEGICFLGSLKVLSLAGNSLTSLPQGFGGMSALEDLTLAGNKLEDLPASFGSLKELWKCSLHGNRLKRLPDSIGELSALKELWLMGNDLEELPESFGRLSKLQQLSVADNALRALPDSFSSLESLTSVWLYGNLLGHLPASLARLPSVKHLWLEGNPISASSMQPLLSGLVLGEAPLKAVGIDSTQAQGVDASVLEEGERLEKLEVADVVQPPKQGGLQLAEPHHATRGYFKLCQGTQFAKEGAPKVVVIAFGSAPGIPNWAGLLRRVGKEAVKEVAGRFDVLYCVDACRSWYGGGDEGIRVYRERLKAATAEYDEVVMVGDSMGATAALLFSDLATHVHAFCPQVDLQMASIRPGEPAEWLQALKATLMESVESSAADITVHTGNWQHDLDQAVMVEPHTNLMVYDFDSHRLALYLDSQQRLLPILRDTVFRAMRDSPPVRLSNIL